MRKKNSSFATAFFAFLIILFMSIGFSVISTVSATEIAVSVFGDVDNDGQTTSNDALVVLRASIGLQNINEDFEKIADVDHDGLITSSDALAILRYSIGYKMIESEVSQTTSGKTTSSKTTSSKTTSSKTTSSKTTSSKATSSKATSSKVTSSKVSDQPGTGHGNYKIILNTKTKKYHTHECSATKKILSQNKQIYYVETYGGSLEDYRYLESFGYEMCGICKKQ